jgi:signal-transduction protein with cAMP-binding, CBS, and nucleotidyltransferase domain
MRGLEPRQYQKNDIILKDRDEVEEILFVLKGDVSLLPALYII